MSDASRVVVAAVLKQIRCGWSSRFSGLCSGAAVSVVSQRDVPDRDAYSTTSVVQVRWSCGIGPRRRCYSPPKSMLTRLRVGSACWTCSSTKVSGRRPRIAAYRGRLFYCVSVLDHLSPELFASFLGDMNEPPAGRSSLR